MKWSIYLCIVLLAGCERWEYHQGYKKGMSDALEVKKAYPGEDYTTTHLFDDGFWAHDSKGWNDGRRDGFYGELARP